MRCSKPDVKHPPSYFFLKVDPEDISESIKPWRKNGGDFVRQFASKMLKIGIDLVRFVFLGRILRKKENCFTDL